MSPRPLGVTSAMAHYVRMYVVWEEMPDPTPKLKFGELYELMKELA